jgi:hypothetical protein
MHGVVYLAWTVGEEATADIHVATSLDHGRSFLAPTIAHHSGGHADAPKIAVDQAGTVHLVYAESPQGPRQTYHITYLRRQKGAARFAPPVPLSSPQPTQGESGNFPALAVSGKEQLFVLWERFPAHRPHGLGFTSSHDGGQTFAAPAIIPGSLERDQGVNGSLQGLLMQKLAANSRGDIAVVNSTFTPGQGSRIWLIRGHAQAD